MTDLRRRLWPAAGASLLVVAVSLLGPASGPAQAATVSAVAASGTAGVCPDDNGVTVVVDMTALGGDVVERCAPGPAGAGFSGVDALQDAGYTVTGTARYGLAFVCRIQGRPAADEALAVAGSSPYVEDCVDTPPQTAFWGYWYAPDGGPWTYSSMGAQTRDVIPGGFEGWAFSLGGDGASPPEPAVDPQRPAASPTSPAPVSSSPAPHPGPAATGPGPGSPPTRTSLGAAVGPGGGAAAGDPPGSGSAPPDAQATTAPVAKSSESSQPPTQGGSSGAGEQARGGGNGLLDGARRDLVRPGTGSRTEPGNGAPGQATPASQVTGDVPATAGRSVGSARPTVIGLGVLVLLGSGAGMTAWRRSRRA